MFVSVCSTVPDVVISSVFSDEIPFVSTSGCPSVSTTSLVLLLNSWSVRFSTSTSTSLVSISSSSSVSITSNTVSPLVVLETDLVKILKSSSDSETSTEMSSLSVSIDVLIDSVSSLSVSVPVLTDSMSSVSVSIPAFTDSILFVILPTDSFQTFGVFISSGILVNINFVNFEIFLLFLKKLFLKQLLDLRDPATNILSWWLPLYFIDFSRFPFISDLCLK